MNKINTSKSFYHYYIKQEIIYDVPFILIKINEVGGSSNKEQFFDNRKIKNINYNNDNFRNFSYSSKIEHNSKVPTNETRNKLTTTSASVKILHFQHKKLNKSFIVKYIKEIIIFLICCVLCIYTVILIYQLNLVNNSYNIFLAFYSNYIQRDKLVNLYSTIISGFYYYSRLVDYSDYIQIDQYKKYIIESAQKYSGSFHTFYQNYIKYRFCLGKDLSSLYKNFNISKISVIWDEINYTNNYMNEVENIVHISTTSSINDDLEDILYDINNFFDSGFKNLTGKERRLKSEYIKILYYFSANMENTYIVFFQDIQNEINNAQDNYSNSSTFTCILIEIIGFFAIIFMISLCMIYLNNTNNNIYKDIANLFIDFTQNEEYTFKNNRDNYIILEKLLQLKFLINNFSVMAIDKYNKKIINTSMSIIDENKIEKSFISKDSKDNTIGKKITNEKEKEKNKKKQKMNKKETLTNNSINNITNNSIVNSKTQGKLLTTNSVNIISKLNQNIYNNKSNVSRSSLIHDTSVQNLTIKHNIKKEEEDNDILTSDKIDDKLKTIKISSIKLNLWILFLIMVILLVYTVVKIIMTMNYIKKTKQVFLDYSIVTFEYSMIIDYFNNLDLILINQDFGREDVLNQMQTKIEALFKKSEEVKKKSIAQYPNVYKVFSVLNRGDDEEAIKKELCQKDDICNQIFDSNFNIAKNGIDVGLRTVSQIIYNTYRDFIVVKDSVHEINKVKDFMTDNYLKVDVSLNFIFILVEDRCAEAFILDCNDLMNSFKKIIISFNIFVICFIVIGSLLITFFIIGQITKLSNIIDKSSVRITMSFCYIKEKNIGYSIKTSSII